MFYTIEELVTQADQEFDGSISELMIATEIETSGRSRAEILDLMSENLKVMLASIDNGMTENTSRTGLTGGDALKLDRYIKSGHTLSDATILTAARNAMAVNESNAQMGLVCATPTAGSAGCVPAVLATAIDKLQLTEAQQLDFYSPLVLSVSSSPTTPQFLVLKVAVRLKSAQLPLWDQPPSSWLLVAIPIRQVKPVPLSLRTCSVLSVTLLRG